jgi:hypothetical protein
MNPTGSDPSCSASLVAGLLLAEMIAGMVADR